MFRALSVLPLSASAVASSLIVYEVDVGRLFVLWHRPSVSLRLSHACSLALWSSSASRQSFCFVFGYESGNTDCVSLLHMVSLTFALGGLELDGRVLPR